MRLLLDPHYQPFAVAGLVILGLLVIEAVTVLGGASLTHFMESVTGGKEPGESGFLGHGLDWINVGRVPLLVLVIVALASFAVMGFAIQGVATDRKSTRLN